MYGLLGRKLGHSYSPQIHSLFADYEYRLFEREETELEDFVKDKDIKGFNVTIPYKKTIIKYLDSLSESARNIGSVNTVVRNADGSLTGYNTDCDGFLDLCRNSAVDFKGRKALILGTGGASAAVKYALETLGAEPIVFISRNGEDNYGNIEKHFDARIIVNTTPVGMYPECNASPLSLDGFEKLEGVFDIVYNPQNTELAQDAKKRGIPAFSGLRMLVGQARKASELFTGNEISEEKANEVLKRISFNMTNIVLIGMPGCGKSSVGKELSQKLEREFIDTDIVLEKEAGMKIPEYIKAYGEEKFRELESEVLFNACTQSGRVIATGGGIVTVERNYKTLKYNSAAVFIKRDLELLATDGRPLSQKFGVEELYRQRLPLYEKFCDFEIDGNGSIKEVTQRIPEELK